MLILGILYAAIVLRSVYCEKILVIAPCPAISHYKLLEPLMKALIERGHHLTVLSYFPLKKKVANFTDVDLRSLSPVVELDFMPHTLLEDMTHLFVFGTEECEKLASSEQIQSLLQAQPEFDLIILEALYTDCALGFVAKYRVPYIIFSALALPFWQSDWIYNPTEVSYIPEIMCQLGGSMNFYYRLQNFGCHLMYRWLYWYQNTRSTLPILRKHFRVDIDSLEDIRQNVSLIFVNTFNGIIGARPVLPNVKEIGGIHLKPPQPLPNDIKKFLDEATDGAIIMSMGSIVKSNTLDDNIKEGILRVFSRLKQRVLWKWEVDFPDPPPNLKTVKWMPQADVLGHPNVKMFIAHGGIHGLFEAINYGVPIVGIPLFGDQQGNLKSLEHRGMAVVIDYFDLGEESLSSAISAILNNESYAMNAKKVSEIFHDRPQKPLETALFWTEYVLRHKGAPHFQNGAARLSWLQYLMVDVLLASFFLIFLFIFSCRYSLKLLKIIR